MAERDDFQREYGIIGQSPEILEIVDVVRQVAPTDITVLITGESGVGKEVIMCARVREVRGGGGTVSRQNL